MGVELFLNFPLNDLRFMFFLHSLVSGVEEMV